MIEDLHGLIERCVRGDREAATELRKALDRLGVPREDCKVTFRIDQTKVDPILSEKSLKDIFTSAMYAYTALCVYEYLTKRKDY